MLWQLVCDEAHRHDIKAAGRQVCVLSLAVQKGQALGCTTSLRLQDSSNSISSKDVRRVINPASAECFVF